MTLNEKNVFLLDGIGALLSGASTAFLLPFFREWTGVPPSLSTPLGILGLCFSVYSFSCFFLAQKSRHSFLLGLIVANLLYSFLLLFLVFSVPSLRPWGIAFFLWEVVVLLGVVALEVRIYANARFSKP